MQAGKSSQSLASVTKEGDAFTGHVRMMLQGRAWCIQEHEHLRITVERVADYKPDVLLVEKSVARYAQELLLQKGISVVLNVKRSLLNRLARCTEAQVRIHAIMQCIVDLSMWCSINIALCNIAHRTSYST